MVRCVDRASDGPSTPSAPRFSATRCASSLSDVLAFEPPAGGFFLWAEIVDPSIDPANLLREAAHRGLQLSAGRNFAATGGSRWDRRLRLAYSSPPLQHLEPAVDRLVVATAAAR